MLESTEDTINNFKHLYGRQQTIWFEPTCRKLLSASKSRHVRDLLAELVSEKLGKLFLKSFPKAKRLLGAHSAGEIPVPIPNTEVKPSSGDYTAIAGN